MAIGVIGDGDPGDVADILAQGEGTLDVGAGENLVGVILRHQLLGQRLERLAVGVGPPFIEAAALVIFGALIVEMVADLMADDRADSAIIDRRVGVGIEERRLQDGGRKDDLLHSEIGVGVDRHRGHPPLPPPDRCPKLGNIIVVRPFDGAKRVAERVAGTNLERRIILPAVGIADLGREIGELGAGPGLGRRRHPHQPVDPPPHRRDDIAHQFVGLGLGFGRIMLGDVQLADVVGQRAGDEINPALPAHLLLGGARQGRAVERKSFLVIGRREHRRVTVERADQQLVFQHLQRGARNEPGDPADRAWLGDDHFVDVDAAVGEVALEVEARGHGTELGDRHQIIGLGRVAAISPGPLSARDGGLKSKDRLGAGGGIGPSGKRQHVGQMGDILGAGGGDLGIVGQIIIAVGHADPALAHLRDITIGVLVVLPDVKAERPADAAATGLGGKRGISRIVRQGVDLIEPRLDRGQTPRLDRGGVEVSGISDAGLVGRILGGFLDDDAGAFLRQIVEQAEHAVIGLVRRDRGILGPGAIGIGVEIIARKDGRIHSRRVETEAAELRGGGWRCGLGSLGHHDRRGRGHRRGRTSGEDGGGGEDQAELVHR